jgi:hypothetical protein
VKFVLLVPIAKASGTQSFWVTANTPAMAIEKFKNGVDTEFVHEEIEVTALGDPEIIEVIE